jgi:hypothetical protein
MEATKLSPPHVAVPNVEWRECFPPQGYGTSYRRWNTESVETRATDCVPTNHVGDVVARDCPTTRRFYADPESWPWMSSESL